MSPPAFLSWTYLRSRTFATLADNGDYRRFFLGQGVSLIGTWLQTAAVSWIVFDMTGSERWLGIVEAAGILPGLFVGLIAGALADRVRPRSMILAMQVLQMTLAFLLAYLVGTGRVRIAHLIGILALTRMSVTFEMPSRQVFLYELVGRESLMNAIGLNSGLFNASRVIGPALAGLCLARLGRTSCFLLNGASYLAAIAALLSIRPRPRSPRLREGSAALLAGWEYLWQDRRVGGLFLLMSLFGLVAMGYTALLPSYVRRTLGAGAWGYSTLLASGGVGATAGALVVASLGGARRRDHLVLSGMTIFGVALAAGSVLPRLAPDGATALLTAVPCLLAAGFGAIVFYSATQTLIQTSVPDHLRGRIMGLWMILYSASVALGALWAGELARQRSVPVVLQLSALICLTLAALAFTTGLIAPRAGDQGSSDRTAATIRSSTSSDQGPGSP